jgi:hypothetical protein
MNNNDKPNNLSYRWLVCQLKQPFPNLMERKFNWLIIISVSLFIGFFLWFFQPFGLNRADLPHKGLFLFGYGGVTFIVLTLFIMILPLFSPATFSNKKWTVGKHILWVTFILLTIGSGNYVYTYTFIDVMQWHWKIIILFILFTMVIGIIPVSIVTLIDVNRKLKKNMETASNINKEIHQNTSDNIDKNEVLILRGKNKNETLTIKEDQFYFLCSEGNYVQIYYQEGTDFKQKMLRNTLHNISQQLQNSGTIVQCHRAYMVNTDKIIKAEGNAQGFKLKLKDLSEKIPVSRKFVPTVKRNLAV